jgi:hypothetical protein
MDEMKKLYEDLGLPLVALAISIIGLIIVLCIISGK